MSGTLFVHTPVLARSRTRAEAQDYLRFGSEPFSDDVDAVAALRAVLRSGTDSGLTHAAGPFPFLTILGSDGATIAGGEPGLGAGWSVASAGDINGDGYADVMIGAPTADGSAGRAYILFGTAAGIGPVNLSLLTPPQGFAINGDFAEEAGWSVAGAGDFNKDGHADIAIGARKSGEAGHEAGAVYLIFGHSNPFSTIDLASLTAAEGFRILGTADDFAGFSVATAGDVNGDGFADLILGAPHAGGADERSGAAFVVFGHDGPMPTLDLGALTSDRGFAIRGHGAYSYAGQSVASAGDVNGDGFDDVIVGVPRGASGGVMSGEAYVIFGHDGGLGDIDLAALNPGQGFILRGVAAGDYAGNSVASAGDINGDGFDDLIVGARYADDDYYAGDTVGKAYVVFGHDGAFGAVDLGALTPDQGFEIRGQAGFVQAGISVASAGDVNGDGFDDIIVGAPYAGPDSAGRAYLIFGREDGFGTIELDALTPEQGFIVEGPAADARAGWSVASAGDVNHDGYDDLIVGAPGTPDTANDVGAAYIIYGHATEKSPLGPPTVDLNGAEDGTGFAVTFTEGDASAAIGGNIAVTAPGAPITSATITITDAIAGDALMLAGALPATMAVQSGGGTAELILTGVGTESDWAAALALVRYTNSSQNPDAFGGDTARTIEVVVGDGLSSSAAAIARVTVAAVNDAPILDQIANDSVSWTEGDAFVRLDLGGDATVADPDSADFAGGSLSLGVLTGGTSADLILVSETGGVSVSGSAVLVGGTTIGTLTSSGGGQPLTVSFNEEATLARVQALLRAIAYTNLGGDNPPSATRAIAGIINDGDGGATGFGVNVTLIPVNDAPSVATSAGARAYAESVNSAPAALAVDPGLSLADPDDGALVSATVTISTGLQPGEDVLAFANSNATIFGNISASYSAGVLTLISDGGTATLAQWQAALRAVTYANSSEEPSQAARTVAFQVNDGDANSLVASRQLSVTAQNDSPSGADGTVIMNEDSVFTFTAAHFGFSDVDGDGFAGVRFGAAPVGGTLFYDADGSGAAAPVAVTTFPTTTYTAADFAAGRLTFVPNTNLNGGAAASIGFTVVDNGGTTGAGQNADLSPNTLRFNITPVNDAPSGTDKTIVINEDSPYTLTLADFGYGDPDGHPFDSVIFSPRPTGGTLLINGTPMAIAAIVYVHTIIAGGVVFVPAANANGAIGRIPFHVRDNGGGDPNQLGSDPSANYLNFNANPVADAPAGADATIIMAEDGVRILTAADFPFTDADGDGLGAVQIDSVSGGTLWFDADGGGANPAVALTTFPAVILRADLDAGRLSFRPAADANGPATGAIRFRVQDDSGAAGGNGDPAANTLAIDVTAVNDAPTVLIGDGSGAVFAGDTFLIDTGPSQAFPFGQVTALADGGFAIVWTSNGLAGPYHAQRYDAGGDAVGPQAEIKGYVVVALEGGDFIALSRPFGPDGDGRGILAQRYDSAWNEVGAEFVVNSVTAGAQDNPAAAALEGGGFVATWTSFDGSGTGIFAQRYDEAGNRSGGQFRVNAETANSQGIPTVEALPGGGFVVIWVTGQSLANGGADVFGQRYDSAGNAWGAEFRVNTLTAGTQTNPALAVLEDGGFVVVWEGLAPDGVGGISGRRYDAAGNTLGAEFRISAANDLFQQVPDVTALAGGGFVVTWDTNGPGDGDNIIALCFDSAGTPVGTEFRVDTVAESVGGPSIAGLADGGLVVAWTSGGTTIHGRRMEPVFQAVEQAALDLKGEIILGDVDAGSGTISVTLTVASGILHVLPGTSGASVSGDASASVTVTGTLAQMNALLGADAASVVSYTADSDTPPASTSLTVTVSDNGNSGAGGVLTAIATQTIAIRSVNDAPTAANPIPDQYGLEDEAVLYQVPANAFFDPDGNPLSYAARLANGDPLPSWLSFDAGTRTFSGTPPLNFAGRLALRVTASDGELTALDDFNLTIEPINDAPSGADHVMSMAEDSIRVLTAADFPMTDVEGHGLRFVYVDSVSGGTLYFDNDGAGPDAAVAVTDFPNVMIRADIDAGRWTFRPTPDASGPGTGAITFRIADDGGAPGAEIDPAANMLAIDVTAVNDAPVNSVPGATQFVFEDATRVFSTANGNAISVVDIDAGGSPLEVTLSVARGTLTLSGISGLSFTAGDGTADATMTFSGTVAAINAALNGLGYTSDLNYNGPDALSIVTSDQGATGTGNVLTDSDTAAISVGALNDAPSGTDHVITIDEDSIRVLTAADFPFTDVENHGLRIAYVDSVSGGTLFFDNDGPGANAPAAVTGFPAVLLRADLDAGKYSFRPTPNATGPAAGAITFRIADDGGAPGNEIDTSANTLTIAVDPVNDAPGGTNVTRTIGEDGNYVFAMADFGFGDPIDGHGFVSVIITTLPANGTLTLSGDAVTAGQEIPVANIPNLLFTPAPNASGAGYGNFTFQVRDNGGTANGGVDTDQSADTFALNVAAVNDAPVNTVPGAQTSDEDTNFTLSSANGNAIGVADADSTTLTVTLSVAHGTLTLASVAGLSFSGGSDGTNDAAMTFTGTVAAINAALGAGLTYSPTANYNGPDVISVTTTDNGAGGAQTDSDSIFITIDPVNDQPFGADKTITLSEDGSYVIAVEDFGFSDPVEGNAFLAVFVNGAPGQGELRLNGNLVVSGQTIMMTDIAAGGLVFTPTANQFGQAYGQFSYQVMDDGGGANFAVMSRKITFDVAPVNDAPVQSVPGAQTIDEDGSFTLSTASTNAISIADVDATTLTVTLTVQHGTLTLASITGLSFGIGDGTADPTMTFSGTAAAINAALGAGLTYNPTANYNGPDAISLTTTDNGQTGTGGILTDSDSVTIAIASVNDAPSGTNRTVAGSEDDPYVFTLADFGFSDPVEGNSFTGVRITTLPGQGQLRISGSQVFAGDVIAASAIGAGLLTFVPDADEFGSPYASFTFQVQDSGGTANGGANEDLTPNTLTITIAPDNLPPVVDLNGAGGGINAAVSYTEDGAAVAIGAGIAVSDPDSGSGDQIVSTTITLTDAVAGDALTVLGSLPTGISVVTTTPAGQIVITLSGVASQAAYANAIAQIRYSTSNQDPTFGGTDTTRAITVIVNDGDVGSTVATSTVTITAADDAAVAQGDSFAITEAGSIAGGNLFANDADPDGPALSISAINGSGGNVGAQIALASGALLTVNANGTFNYDPNGAFLSTPAPGSGASNTPRHDSFSYTLDGGNTATVAITVTGLDSDGDILIGTTGNDSLNGGVGADRMTGLVGNDTYFVDHADDVVVEAAGEGSDQVYSSVSYVLTAGSSVEILGALDAASSVALNLSGNAEAQQIFGNAGVNMLTSGGGADALYGGAGDDVYLVEGDDFLSEAANGGFDQAYSSTGISLSAGAAIEVLSVNDYASTNALTIIGNELAQQIFGNAGANILVSGGGQDALYGGLGDDIYLIDGDDHLVELAGGGFDQAYSSTGITLSAGAAIEVLSVNDYNSTNALTIIGNELAQQIFGNAGANILVGGGGQDALYGNNGDDIYLIDGDDFLTEAAGNGFDQAYSSTNITLTAGAAIEVLGASDSAATTALNLTGNEYGQQIFGNAGTNRIDGGGGNDVLYGLGGADSFVFTAAPGGANLTTIADFSAADDTILLDRNAFAGLAPGALNPNALVIGTQALDTNDRIIYNSATGQLFFDADGSGSGAAVQFATLAEAPAITAADFLVI